MIPTVIPTTTRVPTPMSPTTTPRAFSADTDSDHLSDSDDSTSDTSDDDDHDHNTPYAPPAPFPPPPPPAQQFDNPPVQITEVVNDVQKVSYINYELVEWFWIMLVSGLPIFGVPGGNNTPSPEGEGRAKLSEFDGTWDTELSVSESAKHSK